MSHPDDEAHFAAVEMGRGSSSVSSPNDKLESKLQTFQEKAAASAPKPGAYKLGTIKGG